MMQSWQEVREGEPVVETCLPVGQSVQTVSLEAPMEVDYLPDTQPTQRVAFGSGLNVPAGHDRQEEKEGAAMMSLYLREKSQWARGAP
jgi:hypothetical protein